MLKGPILHPGILHALGRSGHGSKVLISDGNFPHWTTKGANAEFVALNLAPGVLGVTEVLRVLALAIPIEAAAVMAPNKGGPYAMAGDPPIWDEYRKVLAGAGTPMELVPIERFAFYEAAAGREVCLTIATGEQKIYANLLLTIGVVR
jgi:L-fucose mutarotase